MRPVLHRHLDRRRGAHRHPPPGRDALKPLTTLPAAAGSLAARPGRRTFHVWTIGCQMASADSETLSRKLLAAGFEETDLEHADVAVLNTCVVRQGSEDKVYSKLHELRPWKRPDRVIALTGCLVKKAGDDLRRRFPHLDAVVPIGEYDPFVAELEALRDFSLGEPLPVTGRTGVSHHLSVIHGCNHNCTFCIVPHVRGRERSVPVAEVVAGVEAAVADGAREVVLLGQNVDAYRDPGSGAGLAGLLEQVERVPGLRRLRFMTSHPRDLEPELLEVMAASSVICRELQLPVQSGDDGVLKRMARGYLTRHYREIVERARALMPDLAIFTDVIVGFPGETDEQYLNTRRLVEEIEFDVVHAAMYSPRPGTYAGDRLPDDVPAMVKRRRINDLLALSRQIAARKTAAWVGKQVEVLIEGRDELGRPYGRSRQGKRVVVKRSAAVSGELVQVLVEEAAPGQLAGPVEAASN